MRTTSLEMDMITYFLKVSKVTLSTLKMKKEYISFLYPFLYTKLS